MRLWTLLTLVIGFLRIYIANGGINEARCKINCMTRIQPQIPERNLTNCENNLNCSSCLTPCTYKYRYKDPCNDTCESAPNRKACLSSCEYLEKITKQKSGSCPHQEDISDFGLTCLNVCKSDNQCKKEKKCCDNGCGHTCLGAVKNGEDYPPIPEKEKISVEENDSAASVRIRWLPREPPDPGEVILYVVQGRHHSGENFRRRQMGAWYTLLVTDNQVADIPVDVGKFYQFQIAVTNINGSRGYSKATPAITLSRNPTQPSPPENVKKGRSVLFSTGKVNVVISWDPPPPGDLELIRYRVFWSKRVEASPIYIGLEEHKKKVAAPATSCELIGLEQNTKYFIQVQSVAKWGRDKKSSERASILIKVEDFTGNDYHKPVSVDRDWAGPSPVEDIQHSSTFWDGDRLMNDISWQKPIVSGNETIVDRFTIHWKPLQCYNQVDESTMEATVHLMTRFSIYDLIFDCMYLVWVVPVDRSNHLGQAAYNSFRTPSCNEVSITSMPGPICPTIAPDLPSAPQNVSHMFIIGTEISVNISWEVPLNYIQPLTGYRIVSTEYRPHPTNFYRRGFPVLQSSSTVAVRADCKHVILPGLVIGMRYIVTVSATNSIGGGDPAVLDIKTPIVSEPITPTPPTTKPNAHDLSEESVRRTTPRYSAETTDSSGTAVSWSGHQLCISCLILWCTLIWRWR